MNFHTNRERLYFYEILLAMLHCYPSYNKWSSSLPYTSYHNDLILRLGVLVLILRHKGSRSPFTKQLLLRLTLLS